MSRIWHVVVTGAVNRRYRRRSGSPSLLDQENAMSCVTSHTSESQLIESTIVTAADPNELSPLEAVIMDLCNALIEARAEGSTMVESIQSDLFSAIQDYEDSNAEEHPNATWAIPNQRALALSASGEFNGAIKSELIALEHADTPRRLEISLGNLAERCIKAHRYEEAVAWFLEAQNAAPGRTPILLTGAQALFLAGYEDEADGIFAMLFDSPSLSQPGSELDAYLRYESRLRTMADQLPSLSKLLDQWDRACAGSTMDEGESL